MANIHVMDANAVEFRVVCHVAIPVGNNTAGTPWNTSLINSGIGGTTVLKSGDGTAGTISAAELASIQAGNLYEAQATLRVNTVPPAGVAAFLTAAFNVISAATLADLQTRLKFYGASQ